MKKHKSEDNLSFAKQQLGVTNGECGLLGLKWNKEIDEIGVAYPSEAAQPSRRGILGKIAKIYDPLGLVSPTTLQGKMLYREACDGKYAWDAPLPEALAQRWSKWERSLSNQVNVPRILASSQAPIEDVALHAFGDPSGKCVAAAVYAVVTQSSEVNQGLVAAKSRLAKQVLTIPRLELVSGHMTVNLLTNVPEVLEGFPVTTLICWLDSTVALHWVRGNGEYKQFVENCIRKIKEYHEVEWRHIPSHENPADLGSRGGKADQENQLWRNGPEWLYNRESWPPDIVTTPAVESNAEVKTNKLVALAIPAEDDEFDNLLNKTSYWRTMRVCAWVARFAHNVRSPRVQRKRGPLTSAEIGAQERFWVQRVQKHGSDALENDRSKLNLQENA